MNNLIYTLQIITFVTGVTSLILTIINLISVRVKERKTLKDINERLFRRAIESSDIRQLGEYLDNNLGRVTVAEYTTNKKIQKKVNNYIQNIISFIGTEEEVNKVKIEKPTSERIFGFDVDKDLQSAARELRMGQSWNALAQLRRHIEIKIRETLEVNKIELNKQLPINQMLSIIGERKIISLNAVRDLKYAVSICNKAIHGTNITISEAEEAFDYAATGLIEINKMRK